MNKYEALAEWWQGETKLAEEKHLQESLVYRKSHMDWPPGWKNRDKPSEQLHGLKWSPRQHR